MRTMTINNTPLNDKELAERIFSELTSLPTQLRDLELHRADLRRIAADFSRALEQAELDAVINAVIDGKNETARKQQQQAAINSNEAVKEIRNELANAEGEIAAAEVESKTLSRKFNASMAMAELQAARLNLIAKYIPHRKEN